MTLTPIGYRRWYRVDLLTPCRDPMKHPEALDMESPVRQIAALVAMAGMSFSATAFAGVESLVIHVNAQWGEGKPHVAQYTVSKGKDTAVYTNELYHIVVSLKSEAPVGDILEFRIHELPTGRHKSTARGGVPTSKRERALQIGRPGTPYCITFEAEPIAK